MFAQVVTPLLLTVTLQVYRISLRPRPLLELVYHSLAADGRAKHCMFSFHSFIIGRTDIQRR